MRQHSGELYGTVPLGDRVQSIRESLAQINLDDLEDETVHTGAEATWFGIVAARARRLAGEAELTRDVTRAAIAKELDAGALARGEKPLTVDQRKDAVLLDPRYQTTHRAWLETEEAASIAESAKFAVVRKQSHLEQLSGLLAQELSAKRGPHYGSATLSPGPDPLRRTGGGKHPV